MNRFAIAVTGIAGLAAAAQAGPVLFEFEGVSRGRNINIAYGDAESPEYQGRVFAGSIMHQVDDAMLHTYCIDPEQLAQTGNAEFQRVRLERGLLKRDFAEDRSRTLAELADIAGESIWTSGSNQLASAAFQVAAWEVVSDYDPGAGAGSFDLSGGLFRAWNNSDVISAATSLLSQLTFTRADASGYDAFIHGTHQDFMGRSVPAPGAMAIAVIAVPFLANRRRKGDEGEPT
jgi:hypothetical protein